MIDKNEIRYQILVEATQLLEDGEMQQAFEMHLQVIGGNKRVCDAMDRFSKMWNRAYVAQAKSRQSQVYS